MSLSNPLQYSQLAPAAIEAAAKLVETISLVDYYKADSTISVDAFAIARWKAVSIGNLAVTILQTMQFRDEIAGSLPVTPQFADVKGVPGITGGTQVDADTEFKAFLTAAINEVPPCTKPLIRKKPAPTPVP